jgi:hypothetical protein
MANGRTIRMDRATVVEHVGFAPATEGQGADDLIIESLPTSVPYRRYPPYCPCWCEEPEFP